MGKNGDTIRLQKAQRERAEVARGQWWVRALLSTEQDRIGCVLRSAMGIQQGDKHHAQVLDAYGPKCIILDDSAPECENVPFKDGSGVCWTNVLHPGGLVARTEPVFTVQDFALNVQGLVDHLKLDIAEAEALAHLCASWVARDDRKTMMTVHDRIPD